MIAEAVPRWWIFLTSCCCCWTSARRSAQRTIAFPTGRVRRSTFGGLIAVIVFTAGGVFAFVNGLEQILHPEPIEVSWVSYVILGIGLVLNSIALVEALQQGNAVQHQASTQDPHSLPMRRAVDKRQNTTDVKTITAIQAQSTCP